MTEPPCDRTDRQIWPGLATGLLVAMLVAGCGSTGGSIDASLSAGSVEPTPTVAPTPMVPPTPTASPIPAPPVSPIPALGADLTVPGGLAIDAAGSLYVAQCALQDSQTSNPNMVIYRIDAAGQLTRFAGTGDVGFAGDGGPATEALLFCPSGMAFGPDGSLYVADHVNNRVRRIDTSGTITTVAGSGATGVDLGSFSGDGGPAVAATLQEPSDVTLDAAGNLYIADRDNHRVRRVDPAGIITTVAGDGTPGFAGDGGPAVDAQLAKPLAVAIDGQGNLLIADSGNRRVRRVGADGRISTIVGIGFGGGVSAGDGGLATAATIAEPGDLTFGADGSLVVSTYGRMRRVDPTGTISSVAGMDPGTGARADGVLATEASFGELFGTVVDPDGSILFADGFDAIWRIDKDGKLQRVAGPTP